MASTVENILKMIRILQNEECVSGQDLAYRLGVSVKTIQKYKQDLDHMHIFVETKKGRYGGYYLEKSVLEIHAALSCEELESLVLAKKHIENDRNFPKPLIVTEAIDKIIQNERMANSTRKQMRLVNREVVGYSGGFERIKLDKIQTAIREQRIIYIEFETPQTGLTERLVHPYGLLKISGKYMMVGFCELRDEINGFHVEKIKHLALTKYSFVAPEGVEAKWSPCMNQRASEE